MATKIVQPEFYKTDLGLQPFITLPDVSDDIQQALARLLGWDYDLLLWRRLKVDSLGRLVVATGTGTFTNFTTGKINVTNVATVILNANPNRNAFVIKNLGATQIYIKPDAGVSVNDYPLAIGESFTIDSYTGSINGITAAGNSDIRVIEV